MQGWFNIQKSTNVLPIQTQRKNDMIISLDAEKPLTKYNTPSC